MKISIPKENRDGETRIAASPEVVKKFKQQQAKSNKQREQHMHLKDFVFIKEKIILIK